MSVMVEFNDEINYITIKLIKFISNRLCSILCFINNNFFYNYHFGIVEFREMKHLYNSNQNHFQF